MNALEDVSRRWHAQSDHAADGAALGSPMCNCRQVAERMIPFLFDAWDEGVTAVEEVSDVGGIITNPYWIEGLE